MNSIGYNWYFGKVIAYLRKQKGLSQIEYANKIRRIQSAVSRIEAGNQGVAAKDLATFAQPFDLLATDLHKLVSRCFATYKQSDDPNQREKKIRRLCDETIRAFTKD